MKLSIFSLAASVAFALQVRAAPSPQGGLPIFECGGPDHITCPDAFHCCPPSSITAPLGLCVLTPNPCSY
ncbi:hypothetical protein BJ912DRAFT_1141295 [Pholiota molesta]|nr:hypothetical protein BJ912DRAFT_1141295 [Pholiota molesta]